MLTPSARSYFLATLILLGITLLAKRFIPAENFAFELFLFGAGMILGAFYRDTQWKLRQKDDQN